MGARGIERKLALALLAGLAVLCGCAHQYLLILSNGDQIVSLTKPKHQGTNYYFMGDLGGPHVIPANRVVKIKTGSAATEEAKPPAPARPRTPKHWYFLWLA
jgi:hypothetical protein